MALAELAAAIPGLMGSLTSVGGQSGESSATSYSRGNGVSDQESWGYGSSASTGYSRMDSTATGNSVEDSYSRSWGESQQGSYGYSDAYGESQSRTYGREASAQDIANASEANKIQADMWQAQADYNAAEAEKSRQWSQEMQDTYYQRLVQDLKKAGLNPMLALSGYGSSMPTGATASSGLATANKANAYAEQTSSSYNKSHSENSSWGWSKSGSESKSHGESHNNSESHSRSENQSHSSERSGSTGHSENSSSSNSQSTSKTTNNIKELAQAGMETTKKAIGAVKEIYDKANSAKTHSTGGHRF